MSTREVVVVSGVRTAIGDYGGSLKDMPPTKLGAIAIKEAVARAKIDPASVGHVVIGSVIHGEARDMYISRVAAIDAGLPVGTPCLTVNRLCGSGLQAIVSAAQHILLGDTDVVVGGGAESMSRAAYFLPAGALGPAHGRRRGGGRDDRRAARSRSATATWASPRRTSPPSTASRASSRTRSRWNRTSAPRTRSRRAASRSQIVPIELKTRKGVEQFATDEHVRKDAKTEDMQKLKAGVQEGRHGHRRQRLRASTTPPRRS